MATTVKNGTVVADKAYDPNEVVTCDRCGRKFLAKYATCVCRG